MNVQRIINNMQYSLNIFHTTRAELQRNNILSSFDISYDSLKIIISFVFKTII